MQPTSISHRRRGSTARGTQEAVTYLWAYVHGDGSEHPEKERAHGHSQVSVEEQNVPKGSQPSGNELTDGEASLHLGNVSRQAGPKKWLVGWANPGRASAEAEENPRTSEETQEIQETQET